MPKAMGKRALRKAKLIQSLANPGDEFYLPGDVAQSHIRREPFEKVGHQLFVTHGDKLACCCP